MDWSRFLRVFFVSLGASFFVCAGLIVLMNPYGNLPKLAFAQHVITDQQQRFQYPGIIRTRDFDSAIFGTSSIRLLDPADLDPALGRFANLAMNDARAWEQYMLMKLFLRHVAAPRTMVVGIDSVWCAPNADADRVTRRTFPEWMFDESLTNDWPNMLNFRTLEIAGRQVAARLGLRAPALPPNGFRVFTPPDAEYDLERARQHLYGQAPRALPKPQVSPVVLPDAERQALPFPALRWLQEIAQAAPAETRFVALFVPTHAGNVPAAGTREAAIYAECRRQIIEIARARKGSVVDFRFRSPLTEADTNFWDPLHYRVPIARKIAQAINAATLEGQTQAPDGTWTAVDAPR